jgi:hypothetical protein
MERKNAPATASELRDKLKDNMIALREIVVRADAHKLHPSPVIDLAEVSAIVTQISSGFQTLDKLLVSHLKAREEAWSARQSYLESARSPADGKADESRSTSAVNSTT